MEETIHTGELHENVIRVVGARQHNLKNINVEIPRDKFVVITGLSGSGKSSLAFDTIFAEGQRRYVESLSAYARQFLGQMEKPDVDYIDGLSPAVSIDQKSTSRNPRSTVGTVTEIYDYLRLLFARIGIPHCPICGREVGRSSAQEMVDALKELEEGTRLMVLAPIVRSRKGTYQAVFDEVRKAGFLRVRVDGELYDIEDEIELDRYKQHDIEVVIDRIIVRKGESPEEYDAFISRLTDSVETALQVGEGYLIVVNVSVEPHEDLKFSESFSCPEHGPVLQEIEPRTFSFNTPHGACPECQGLGEKLELDPDLIVPNWDLSINEGGIAAMEYASIGQGQKRGDTYYTQVLRAFCDMYNISMDQPLGELDEEKKQILFYGADKKRESFAIDLVSKERTYENYRVRFGGIITELMKRYADTNSEYIRGKINEYMSPKQCQVCHGDRLNPEALGVTIDGKNIIDLTIWPVKKTKTWIERLLSQEIMLGKTEFMIAERILKEIDTRLGFLVNVGLDYLTLKRSAATLSGGEAQRIRLATQVGSQLRGVLYVLDEPSIGLHPRDNKRLLDTLMGLRDIGNTVLVVEHDEETIMSADWIIDLGPLAGEHGGELVAEGDVDTILGHPVSLTGAYLSHRLEVPFPEERRDGNGNHLTIFGACENNLKNVDVEIPLGKLVCITGVSGSGKSTLMVDVLYKSLAHQLNRSHTRPGKHDRIEGVEALDKIIEIDQSPIGRTPRSNPGTYTGIFDEVRKLYADLAESKMRGYKAGRFSFNVRGGRCEACQGQGQIKIEMQFLPDIYVPCEVCHGARFNRETLQVKFKGMNIADVLDMTVEQGISFFDAHPKILTRLETLHDVGLGYIRIGQPATTLSGGEAQRVKLAKELSRRATGRTMYVLDEPSVGLHAADVHKLIEVLERLVDKGNSVLIIEHNLDIIKTADYIIDMGPEGGDAGGEVIACGLPEEVCQNEASYTGKYLRRYLKDYHEDLACKDS
ncbi:MAG: excinuclease ABC subunit UvrA [Anaerolineae bacterium]|jgi:excinuclease ABC subunit A|nr:excinuclease ABC subunit UvrA [Anaerolineae bacterium]